MKTEYLLNREVDQVLSVLTDRNRMIMRVALHTGLRVGDVLKLETAQLKPHFWVTETKTGKRRQVGLPEPLLSDIKKQAGKQWAFPGRSGQKPQTRQAVWKDVKRAAKAFRLPQNVGPHSARKVYAVQLLEEYGDIERVRRALNHSSQEVTMIYAMADLQLKTKKRRRAKPGGRRV
jgi:integrase